MLFFSLRFPGLKARALWDHYEEEQTGNYLNFNTGEVITVLKQEETGWWVGYHNEQIGRFPYNYVEITEGIPVTSNENKSFHDLIDVSTVLWFPQCVVSG